MRKLSSGSNNRLSRWIKWRRFLAGGINLRCSKCSRARLEWWRLRPAAAGPIRVMSEHAARSLRPLPRCSPEKCPVFTRSKSQRYTKMAARSGAAQSRMPATRLPKVASRKFSGGGPCALYQGTGDRGARQGGREMITAAFKVIRPRRYVTYRISRDQVRAATAPTPETWDCVDCGVDTAPGIFGRTEALR